LYYGMVSIGKLGGFRDLGKFLEDYGLGFKF
jgi:hypothetical protein